MANAAQPNYIAQARALEEQARLHKREERRHRQAAREARQRLATLLAFCEAHGIHIEDRTAPMEA